MQFFFYFFRSRFFTLGPSVPQTVIEAECEWLVLTDWSGSSLALFGCIISRFQFERVYVSNTDGMRLLCISSRQSFRRQTKLQHCNADRSAARRLPSRWSEGPPNTGKECIIIMLNGALYSVKAMFSSIDLSFNIFRLYFSLILACASPRMNQPMMIRYAIDQFMESIRVFFMPLFALISSLESWFSTSNDRFPLTACISVHFGRVVCNSIVYRPSDTFA